jgi:hypothetical protein
MRKIQFLVIICSLLAAPLAGQESTIVIRAGMLLDGKGGVQRNASIKALALNYAMIKKAVSTPGLKLVLGTDAVAGAHGRNADELIARVREGGQKPMDAIISATSLAAESLNLQNSIGGHKQLLLAGPSHPRRGIEQQLSTLRPQIQYRRRQLQ